MLRLNFAISLVSAVLALTCCGTPTKENEQEQQHLAAMALKDPDKIYPTVLQEATELQGKIVDGWFRGEDPRSLKSGYRDSSAAIKAHFACDYARMLNENGQDLVNRWTSYVPYSKRSEYARKWWTAQEHSTEFTRADHWMQIIWLREALLDGSELWWRAFEKQYPGGTGSAAALAHDAEQDMVGKFKENESSPARSFSELDK
jgi:hypothetical protein